MALLELFALVEKTEPPAGVHPAIASPAIKRLIRTYEGRTRADEDLELVRVIEPGGRFDVIQVDHIDS